MKRHSRLMLLAILFMLANPPLAMTQVQEWVARFNGAGNGQDQAFALGLDQSGNVYVTGYTNPIPQSITTDYATVKYTSNGVLDWAAFYNGPANRTDEARHIHVDGTGNVTVAGTSYGGTSISSRDFAAIRYNTSGIEQWIGRYNTPTNREDYLNGMSVDGEGSVFLTGAYITQLGFADTDWKTVKFNDSGVLQWTASYGGPAQYFDVPRGIAADNSGGVYVTGEACFAGQNWNFVTIKYDRLGNQEWLRVFDSEDGGYDGPINIAVDVDGGVYVTGSSNLTGSGVTAATTIKYGSNGDQLWVSHYGNIQSPQTVAYYLEVIPRDGVCIAGYTNASGDYHKSDILTVRYGADGDLLWANRYDGPASDRDGATALSTDAAGNVYTAGSSYATASDSSSDYVIIKYNRTGAQQWVVRYDGPGNSKDIPSDSFVDNAGNVYVTGYSYSGADQSSSDYATIKYSQPGWPSIVQQPISHGVCVGVHAMFNTIADSPTETTYQWRRNGAALETNGRITGINTSTLTIYPVLISDAGSYDVIVGNEIGATVSQAATLAPAGGGDGNFDGRANGLDIQLFVQWLISGQPTDTTACPFDMNADGIVDVLDVAPYAIMLLES